MTKAAKKPARRPARRVIRVHTKKRTNNSFDAITQRVGATARAFGTRGRGATTEGLDAFHPAHLTLPRAVGAYLPLTVTDQLTTNAKLIVLGPCQASASSGGRVTDLWTNCYGYSMNSLTNSINAAGAVNKLCFDAMESGSWSGSAVTPAAFSVQIMNPNAVQTTNGIVYAGRFHTLPDFTNATAITGQVFANNFVSFNAPRLLAAAKLAFRGIKVNAIPFNMSAISDFTSLERVSDTTGTTLASSESQFEGFAPICIYNPDAIQLQFLVACEWRARFDLTNPAQAAHSHHPVSSDRTWGDTLKTMWNQGHGVSDIAAGVARAGARVVGRCTVRAIEGGAVRALPMLMG